MNFVKAVKKIPNPNRTNSHPTSKKGTQQPHEDSQAKHETTLSLHRKKSDNFR